MSWKDQRAVFVAYFELLLWYMLGEIM